MKDYLVSESRLRRSVTTEGLIPGESTLNDDNLDFTLGFNLDGVPDYTDLEVGSIFVQRHTKRSLKP